MVTELEGAQASCALTGCRLFIRVKSNIKASCDFIKFSCQYSESSNSYVQNLKQLEKLNPKWDTYLIYDFDINEFNYKITEFKLPPQNTVGKNIKSSPFLFSDKNFTDLIKKDLEFYANNFRFLIIGSDLDLLFALSPPGEPRLKNEIAAFWETVFEIKQTYPNAKISTSLSYEHMRGTNFWIQMDIENIKKLDFFSMSSSPLSLRWTEYSNFFIQLYLYTEDKEDLLNNYYDALDEFVTAQLPIVLTEFHFPLEANDPYRFQAFLELSNFFTYFKHATFCIKPKPTPSSYLKKTTFLSIKNFNELKKTL
ncbi:MAG: hypothetical protein B7Y39_11990 [Bdellovibrio sp. 28-41-41]|nr:MAG: hypothetical protein B7Y39_11990 [Bdellovibrio sp. 28-41-41]